MLAEDHLFIRKYEQTIRAIRDKPDRLASQKKEYLGEFLKANKPTRQLLHGAQNLIISNLVEDTIKKLEREIANEPKQSE